MGVEELSSWLRLARVNGLHAGHIAPLLAQGGSPLALLRESRTALQQLGLGDGLVAALRQPEATELQQDIAWLQGGPARQIVTWGSADYPPLLSRIPDAPLVLFVAGNPRVLSLPQLAIVGSRNPTALGRDTATQFAAHLARTGLAITSGLALGIDAAAHRGALQAVGHTVAVVGRGLDATYPRENEGLAAQIIAAGGALVTDLPPGTPPLKQNFPRRNRLISGLSVGTLVVEAALQSGSLITARLASEQGREVFAIPGSIHNPLSRGCHRLIREGAKLVENAADIFAELEPIMRLIGQSLRELELPETPPDRPSLDKDYEILLDALGFEPASLDTLVARTGLKADAVASMLLILELDGRVQQQPGGRFSRHLPGKV
jgi:DNA processing protein